MFTHKRSNGTSTLQFKHSNKGSEPRYKPVQSPAIGVAQHSGKVSERAPYPDFSQLIEQKTWENDQLRQELEHERAKYLTSHRARTYIGTEAKRAVESLKQALVNFDELQKSIEELAPE
jgi:hypothetical protein